MPRQAIRRDDPDQLTPDQAVQVALDLEREQRLWLKLLMPILTDITPPASSPAVEFGRNLVRLAACRRACAILRSDRPVSETGQERTQDEVALAAEA
jgi:hypothetical protein